MRTRDQTHYKIPKLKHKHEWANQRKTKGHWQLQIENPQEMRNVLDHITIYVWNEQH
jgi:hypothetical protein